MPAVAAGTQQWWWWLSGFHAEAVNRHRCFRPSFRVPFFSTRVCTFRRRVAYAAGQRHLPETNCLSFSATEAAAQRRAAPGCPRRSWRRGSRTRRSWSGSPPRIAPGTAAQVLLHLRRQSTEQGNPRCIKRHLLLPDRIVITSRPRFSLITNPNAKKIKQYNYV